MGQSPRYNPAFDGLRAIAAMLVIADHCHVPGFNPGYFGVDLFFVLSGYLITGLLIEELQERGQIDLVGFYLRRLLRLTPPLLLMLAAYIMVAPMLWTRLSFAEHFGDAALAAFYLSDYTQAFWHYPHALVHTWSLSVEEHFYLVWPFVILLIARLDPRRRIVALALLFLLATTWRILQYDSLGWQATYYRFDTRIGGLVLGAILALGLPRLGTISDRTANTVGTAACAAFVVCLSVGHWHEAISLVSMVTLAQVAAVGFLIASSAPNSWVSMLLSTPLLVNLGVISYGVYLWHYPAAVYLRNQLPWHQTLPIVLAFAITAATVSYWVIERPLQKYRRNLKHRRRGLLAEPVAADAERGQLASNAAAPTQA